MSIKADEVGLWAVAQLDLHKKFAEAVLELVQEGALHWSSGSLAHLVEVGSDGKIKRWPLVEGSLTPTPAEPRKTDIFAIKTAYEELGLDTNKLSLPTVSNAQNPKEVSNPKEGLGGLKADNNTNNDKQDKGQLMSPEEREELKNFIEEEVKSAITKMLPHDEEDETKMVEDEDQTKMEEDLTEEVQSKMEEELTEEEAKSTSKMRQAVRKAIMESAPDVIERTLEKRLQYEDGLKSIGRKAQRQAAMSTKAESQAGYEEQGQKSNGGYEGSTFKGMPGIDTGFHKRVDATPLLFQVKSAMPRYAQDEDVQRYAKYRDAANKASGISGANLDFLAAPAQREALVEELLPKTFLDKVGVLSTTVEGNQTVERPKLTKSPKGVWLGENDAVPEDTFTAEMLLATPKPLAAFYQLPIAALARMDSNTENMLRNQLLTRLALAINEAALRGIGNVNTGTVQAGTGSTGAQPLGVLPALPAAQISNLSTNGRAPTPKDMSNMKSAVEARDIELGEATHWVYHSNVLNYFEDLTDTTGQLLNRSQWTKGYEPVTTTIALTNLTAGTGTDLARIYFGDWSYFEIVQSNMINVRVFEDSVYATKLQVGVMAWTFVDFLIHYSEAFEIREAVKV